MHLENEERELQVTKPHRKVLYVISPKMGGTNWEEEKFPQQLRVLIFQQHCKHAETDYWSPSFILNNPFFSQGLSNYCIINIAWLRDC